MAERGMLPALVGVVTPVPGKECSTTFELALHSAHDLALTQPGTQSTAG